MQVDTIEIMVRVLGGEHPTTLQAKFELAESLRILRSLGQAVPHSARLNSDEGLHKEVLEARRRTLGSAHPASLTSLTAVAMTHLGQRNYDDAAETQLELLELKRQIYGMLHPMSVCAAQSLAKTYNLQDDVEGANATHAEIAVERQRIEAEKIAAEEEEKHRLEMLLTADDSDDEHHQSVMGTVLAS